MHVNNKVLGASEIRIIEGESTISILPSQNYPQEQSINISLYTLMYV